MKNLDREKRLGISIFVIFYAILITRNSWISDDAYITFRSIENFLAGYGLGYNPFIRVQAFTHPLWMFLISLLYSIERLFIPHSANALFYLTIFISIILSCVTLYLLIARIANANILTSLLTLMLLTLSNAFIDYSSSGLENPLTHFLLVVFILIFLSQSQNILGLTLLTSLLALNRLDAILLTLPVLAYCCWIHPKRVEVVKALLLGLIPLIGWTVFSIFYFGFPFPNTAYAKLNTGINTGLLIQQGLDYLLNAINWDPVTIFALGLAGVGVYISRHKDFFFLYLGVVLYLVYVVSIGGDFMSGRFLAAPLLVSSAVITHTIVSKKSLLIAVILSVLLGAFSNRSPLNGSNPVLQFPTYPIGDRNSISDQRLYYFGNPEEDQFNSFVENGFREADLGSTFAGDKWYFSGVKRVLILDALGKLGYQSGPNTYVIDNYALADPLLARLPVDKKYWQIGHFRRDLPDGYLETLETGENLIHDPDMNQYFSSLNNVIHGPLWDWHRMVDIWNFNTGQYDSLIN